MTESRYPRTNFASRPLLDRKSVINRLGLFVGGAYAASNLSSVLVADRKDDNEHIHIEMWSAPGTSKPTFEEAKTKLDSGAGQKIEKGVKFGPSWTQHWLKMTLTIPPSWKSKESVELNFDPSCEAMIFDQSGLALQGITGGFDYNRRVEYIIPQKEVKAGRCVRYIEVSANGVFGMQPQEYWRKDVSYTLETVEIVVVNPEARALAYDFETLAQLSENQPDHSPLGNKARATGNTIMNTFDGTLKSVEKCRKLAKTVLGEEWEKEYSSKAIEQEGTLWAIGYCHIDTAWLWPWSATKKKVARSWSSQLDLMDRYPEYRFMATAAQHFQWLEQLYPKLFERLQEKVKTGQFEVNGACWVEMDANIPSGESLCRQFLYGQKYFQTRFGKRSDVLILPDTFGFGPQLPQIARLGGCDSYFSHKLNWSKINRFPYTSFNWVGLDGTQLLSHITPIQRYDSLCTMDEITRANVYHKNLDVSPDSVIAFGHGDGGGGPRPLLMERLRRARAVAMKGNGQSEEMPLIKQGATLSDFFEHLRKTTDNGSKLPDWYGEMYLETHRGVQTSQSNTKRNFRKSEILLRQVELFSTLASIQAGYAYPKERIDKCYETLCLCMFHDTLPGSSIRLAVEDYDDAFAGVLEAGKDMLKSAIRALGTRLRDTSDITILNTLPGIPRCEFVDNQGKLSVAQASIGDLTAKVTSVKVRRGVSVEQKGCRITLRNDHLRVEIEDGRIFSIYDTDERRELLAHGCTAGFTIFEDHTDGGEAWEFEQYELDKFEQLKLTDCTVISSGPARGIVECALNFGNSKGVVRISLDAIRASQHVSSKSMLKFDFHVDWHERHRMLKFEVPLALFSDFATYDAAFGVHRRPTTRNTSWETAKFEVPSHKFADYSEFGYGVALLNDCKYGHSAQGNLLTLSLFKGPTSPDEEADQGKHDVSFALLPHKGTFAESDVQNIAHAFNQPLMVIPGSFASGCDTLSVRIANAPNVLLETVKRGEVDFDPRSGVEKKDDVKTIIIRLHEHMGGRACAKLVIDNLQVSKAELVNVLEDTVEELDLTTSTDKEVLDLEFRGFEIKTVKLTL